MKKQIYIQPAMEIMAMQATSMIAVSARGLHEVKMGGTENTIQSSSDVYVKTSGTKDVWDEDWSKQ